MIERITALIIGGFFTQVLLIPDAPFTLAGFFTSCLMFLTIGLGAKCLFDVIIYGDVKQ